MPTLREAVAFYDSVEFNNSPAAMPPPMGSGLISISTQDIDDITAFLETLVEPFVDCDNSTIDDRVEIAAGSPDCDKASDTVSSRSPVENWTDDRLTASTIGSGQFATSLQAFLRSHAPTGSIRPISSDTGINSAGETIPRSG